MHSAFGSTWKEKKRQRDRMKHRQYILQEYDNHPIPGWRDLDGTVRHTRDEAETLLKEFESGKGYSMFGTKRFRIEEFEEDDSGIKRR